MTTILTYLDAPLRLECSAQISAIEQNPRTGLPSVSTDRTPFYLQGGGQPTDRGELLSLDVTVPVVGLSRIGDQIFHDLATSSSSLSIGDVITLKVDAELRHLHCRLHTAGELLCLSVRQILPRWRVKSAIHFPGNASVTFMPDLKTSAMHQAQRDVENCLRQLVEENHAVAILPDVHRAEAEKLIGYSLADLPQGVPIRLVNPAPDFYRACMGTHVQRTGEIETVRVRNIKERKGLVTISYELAGNITALAA
jgi:Ser-tRNA(Ala) deacylase AlaX